MSTDRKGPAPAAPAVILRRAGAFATTSPVRFAVAGIGGDEFGRAARDTTAYQRPPPRGKGRKGGASARTTSTEERLGLVLLHAVAGKRGVVMYLTDHH